MANMRNYLQSLVQDLNQTGKDENRTGIDEALDHFCRQVWCRLREDEHLSGAETRCPTHLPQLFCQVLAA